MAGSRSCAQLFRFTGSHGGGGAFLLNLANQIEFPASLYLGLSISALVWDRFYALPLLFQARSVATAY